MEENKDNHLGQEETKAEYTGEYGNSVEGEYKAPEAPSAEHVQNAQADGQAAANQQPQAESSLYSYNYQNGNSESTHSGDYYESRNHSQDSSTAASSSGQNSTYQSQGSEPAGNSSQGEGTTGSSYGSQGTGASGSSYSSQSTGASGSGYGSQGTGAEGSSYGSQGTGAAGSSYNSQSTGTSGSGYGSQGTGAAEGSSYSSQSAGAAGSSYSSQSTGASGSSYGSQSTGASGSSSYSSQGTGAGSSSYGSQSTGASGSGYSSQSTGAGGSSYSSQNAGAAGNSGYSSPNAGNTYGSQNQLYQNANFSQGGGNSQMQDGKPSKKKGSSLGMKILVTAVCAVLFGVIAGTCFQAVNLVTQRIIGTTQQEEVKEPAAGTDNKQQSNISSNEGKTVINNTVTDVSAITEQTMPALVAITSTTKGTDYYDLFGQYYPGQDATSCGTGIIVGQNDKELLIATNNHVIDGAKTISIQFIDGEVYEATEKGSDSSNDLAVVAVKVSDVKKDTMGKIKIADLGNSDEAKVGQMVIAIGNALGYGQSITVGWISAKDREITEEAENGKPANKIKAIQTDAAINPGNSGGALINMQGQVIGINSAKIAASTVEGVGYAIPISVAIPIIDDLMNREILEDSEKGYLGIQGSTVSEAASAYNIPYGVHVKEVAKGGAAEKGGIMPNDIITAINKMEVTTMESLQEKVNSYRKGTEVEVTIQRSSNGKYQEKIVKVTLQGSESLDSLPDDNSGNNNNNGNYGGENDGNEYGGGNDGNEYGGNNGNDYGNGGGSGSIWDYFFN